MKETPWSRARKLRYERQEERLGKLEGGSRQANSGRFWRWKRDVKLYEFLVEARTNEKPGVKSYRIEADEWMKLRKDAFQTPPGLRPAMQITIGELDLFVLELKDWHTMYTRLIQMEGREEEI